MKALVDDVNHGSQEQANGIEQIGKAIVQMQQVTHQTAASAEESAAAAEELTAQSETLRAIVEGLTAARTRIAGAIRRPAPMPPSNAATAPGLRALATAVERKSPGPRMQPAPTGALAGKNAFPLDEDFSSF